VKWGRHDTPCSSLSQSTGHRRRGLRTHRCCGGARSLSRYFANTAAALTMVIVIVAVAVIGPRPAGIVASASAALWFDFFLTSPYDRFAISHRPDLETTIAIFVVGCS